MAGYNPDSDTDFRAEDLRDNQNYVQFYKTPKFNKSGEYVCELDFILIISPGMAKTEVRREARDEDKKLYRKQWQAYEDGEEQKQNGTPLELLGISTEMRGFLQTQHFVYTIEQLASLEGSALQNVGMGGTNLKLRAEAFMSKSSKGESAVRVELAEANETIAQLMERVKALETKGKGGMTTTGGKKRARANA